MSRVFFELLRVLLHLPVKLCKPLFSFFIFYCYQYCMACLSCDSSHCETLWRQGLRDSEEPVQKYLLVFSVPYSFLFLDIPTEIVIEVHEGKQGEDAVPSSSEVTHNSHYQQHQTTQFICLPAEGCQTLVTVQQQIKVITSQLLPVFCTQT